MRMLLERASNDRFAEPDVSAAPATAAPKRYSLLCHETRTRVVVGIAGGKEEEMISAIRSDSAMDAFCSFVMHNRLRTVFVYTQSLAEPAEYADYFEFLGWTPAPPLG